MWGIRIGVLWPQGRANTQKNGEISQAAGRKTNRPGGGRRQGCRGGEAGGGGAHVVVVWRVGGVARSSWFFAVDGGPPHHSVSSATFLVFLVGVVRESEGSSQTADRRTACDGCRARARRGETQAAAACACATNDSRREFKLEHRHLPTDSALCPCSSAVQYLHHG